MNKYYFCIYKRNNLSPMKNSDFRIFSINEDIP